MLTDRETYRQAVISLYLRLPHTPPRLSRFDLRLLDQLWQRQIPLTVIETPSSWPPSAAPLVAPTRYLWEPIRSLHYFLPVIEELLANPIPESYLAYLRSKVALCPGDAKTAADTARR